MLRTPDDRFHNLPDFPYTPHYLHIGDHRIHFIDEGQGDPVLCLHGEPTWSFLYRKLIPPLVSRHRVVAFDFIGFGRSDKLPNVEDYTFDLHRQTLLTFVEALNLHNITLVVHDWGGLIGLPTALEMQERISRLVILNTFLPAATEPPTRGFLLWRKMVERAAPDLPVGGFMQNALPDAPPDVIAAYEAPFPSVEYKAGAVAFPLMVPLEADDPIAQRMATARQAYATWDKPTLVMFAKDDPVLGAAADFFTQLIPHATAHHFEDGGHFLQERHGATIAQRILDWTS